VVAKEQDANATGKRKGEIRQTCGGERENPKSNRRAMRPRGQSGTKRSLKGGTGNRRKGKSNGKGCSRESLGNSPAGPRGRSDPES